MVDDTSISQPYMLLSFFIYNGGMAGIILQNFLFDVCVYVLFFICVGTDFVDLT